MFAQRLAVYELGRNEVPAAILSDIVNRNNIRVIERGSRIRLLPEALDHGLVASPFRREEFEGYVARQFSVTRQVNFPHPASFDEANDPITADGLSLHRPLKK